MHQIQFNLLLILLNFFFLIFIIFLIILQKFLKFFIIHILITNYIYFIEKVNLLNFYLLITLSFHKDHIHLFQNFQIKFQKFY